MMTTFSSGCGAALAAAVAPASPPRPRPVVLPGTIVSSPRLALARPPHAINAMSSFPFRSRPRRIAGAPVITPAAARAVVPTNSRRVTPRTDDFFSLVLNFFIDDSCVQGRGLKTPALQRVGYLLRIRSEREPCADLHRARRAVGDEPADRHEVRIREARVWIAPLRMVQHVRRFYPQLKPIVADRNRSEE